MQLTSTKMKIYGNFFNYHGNGTKYKELLPNSTLIVRLLLNIATNDILMFIYG